MSDPETTTINIPDALIDAFKMGKVIVFAGSGLSSFSGGYPNSAQFAELLRNEVVTSNGKTCRLDQLIKQKDSDDNSHNNTPDPAIGLSDVAEYFELFTSSDRLFNVIKQKFNVQTISPIDVHRELWELPNTRHIFTTNFDPLIEHGLSLSRTRAAPRVITDPHEFRDVSLDDYLVFKLHGCAVRSHKRDDLVITRSDYLRFEGQHPLRKLKAQSELMQNTFLFLGYSLDDPDFQSLYTEVRLFAGQAAESCFAVIQKVSPAKVDFWKRFGLHILRGDAKDMIRAIRNSDKLRLYTRWYEWRRKEGAREDTKQAIAQKAIDEVLKKQTDSRELSQEATNQDSPRKYYEEKGDNAQKGQNLTLVMDSGTTTLAFAKRLKVLLDHQPGIFESVAQINVLTNCAAILDLLRWLYLPPPHNADGHRKKESNSLPSLQLWVLGGWLRTQTQALVPAVDAGETDSHRSTSDAIDSFLKAIDNPGQVVALMGATAVNSNGFRTNTREERAVKRGMINGAQRVIFLVDHSKFVEGGDAPFMTFDDVRQYSEQGKHILVITDRIPSDTAVTLRKVGIDVRLVSGELPSEPVPEAPNCLGVAESPSAPVEQCPNTNVEAFARH